MSASSRFSSSSSQGDFWQKQTSNNTTIELNPKFASNVSIQNNLIVGNNIEVLSDKNFKDNIKSLTIDPNLVLNLNPVQYTLNSDSTQRNRFGFIAQEIETVFPNLVCNKEDEDLMTIYYLEIIPLLLHKIKDLQHQIDSLKK
jgi:hypothetical protein